ncbi:MAG: nuclease [Gammaproteobacteria bacterium]|nr:nuclease [Gammaproteobacteria bacterium]
MNNSELEKILVNSLSDLKLDQDESFLFKKLSASLPDDKLNFVRNKAFDLTRSLIESGGKEAFRALNWLERVVKAIQPLEHAVIADSSVCFSPGNDCRNKITSLLKLARKEVNICVFTISDNRITKSILEAHERGVKVTVISDNDKTNDRGSDVDYLASKGVTVLVDDSPYHMHHKFALFDKRILLSGSFNWTRSASEYNEENILVTTEQKLVSAFSDKFELLRIQFAA